MLEAILSRAGYRVGCYTSPHLLRYNERVRINRKEASDDELCNAFQDGGVGQDKLGRFPDLFRIRYAGGDAIVQSAEVEIAILEVGLGGRLDAVNIFDADCAVLTSVDFDHMDYLGDTREKIGFEKAGIFRSGKAAICSEPDIPAAVRHHAKRSARNFMHIGEHFGYSARCKRMELSGEMEGKRHSLPYPALRGAYQLHNASACLAALDAMKDSLPITMGDIRQGLLEVNWPGRFQVLPGRPVTVLDVAHNPGAARALADDLGRMGRIKRLMRYLRCSKIRTSQVWRRRLATKIDIWLTASINAARGASSDEIVQIRTRRS